MVMLIFFLKALRLKPVLFLRKEGCSEERYSRWIGIKLEFLLEVVIRIKRGKTPFVTIRMDLESIMLSEMSTERDK